MADLFAGALKQLASTLNTNAGTAVTLRRFGKTDTETTVTKDIHQQTDDQNFGHLLTKEQDWIFQTADYEFDDAATLPNRGDTIQEEGADGITYTYEVMGDELGVHWDWMDPSRAMIRVRTNLIEKA